MNLTILAQVAEQIRQDLEVNAQIEAVGLFGSLERHDIWEHSDIDLFVITTETDERWEGVYLRRQGVLVHLQLLSSATLRAAMQRVNGGPFFAALSGVQIWFDRVGQLTSAVETAIRFDQPGRSARACKEYVEGIGHLHRAERCHRFDYMTDASFELVSALRCFAAAHLVNQGVYPPRELCAKLDNHSSPEVIDTCQVGDSSGLASSIERTWLRARSEMELHTRWIVECVNAQGTMTYHQLSMDPKMRGITLCERLFDEMVSQGLLKEVEIQSGTTLGLQQIAYRSLKQ